jgi:membrane protein required for colicin V production
MNLLDILLILIVGVCFALGFWNGLVKQLASILGIVAGVVVAARLAPWLASAVQGRVITDPQVAHIAAYVFLFLLAALAVWLIGLLVRRLLKHAELGLTDRIWGALFGLVKGVVFCWALLLAIVLMGEESSLHQQLQQGCIAPRLLVALNVASVAFPRELGDRLGQTVKRWWESGVAPGTQAPEEPPAQPSGPGPRRDYR